MPEFSQELIVINLSCCKIRSNFPILDSPVVLKEQDVHAAAKHGKETCLSHWLAP